MHFLTSFRCSRLLFISGHVSFATAAFSSKRRCVYSVGEDVEITGSNVFKEVKLSSTQGNAEKCNMTGTSKAMKSKYVPLLWKKFTMCLLSRIGPTLRGQESKSNTIVPGAKLMQCVFRVFFGLFRALFL